MPHALFHRDQGPGRGRCAPRRQSLAPLVPRYAAPSRGDPPRRAVRGRNAARAERLRADSHRRGHGREDARAARTARTFSMNAAGHNSELAQSDAGEAPSCGGWGREGVRSEARAEQRLAPGGPQAPITRTTHWRAALPLPRRKQWRAALPLTRRRTSYSWLRTKLMVDSPGSLQSVSWMCEMVRSWRTMVAASSAAFITSSAMAVRCGGRSGEPTSISA